MANHKELFPDDPPSNTSMFIPGDLVFQIIKVPASLLQEGILD